MMSATAEIDVLDRVLQQLEMEGYLVYRRPNKLLVPKFLGDITPAAIALRDDKNLIVEVTRPNQPASSKLAEISTLVFGQDKWELRVVWLNPMNGNDVTRVEDRQSIAKRLDEVRKLAAQGHLEPAMLLCWATFEAIARALMPQQLARPQSATRLVEIVAGEGIITPTEADRLRLLAAKRNSLAHGDLQTPISTDELNDFASILDTLMLQLPAQ
jgi:REase_AHJR-like